MSTRRPLAGHPALGRPLGRDAADAGRAPCADRHRSAVHVRPGRPRRLHRATTHGSRLDADADGRHPRPASPSPTMRPRRRPPSAARPSSVNVPATKQTYLDVTYTPSLRWRSGRSTATSSSSAARARRRSRPALPGMDLGNGTYRYLLAGDFAPGEITVTFTFTNFLRTARGPPAGWDDVQSFTATGTTADLVRRSAGCDAGETLHRDRGQRHHRGSRLDQRPPLPRGPVLPDLRLRRRRLVDQRRRARAARPRRHRHRPRCPGPGRQHRLLALQLHRPARRRRLHADDRRRLLPRHQRRRQPGRDRALLGRCPDERPLQPGARTPPSAAWTSTAAAGSTSRSSPAWTRRASSTRASSSP